MKGYYLFLSVGICLGPFVSSFMLSLHREERNACHCGRQSISILATVWALVAFLATRLMPPESSEKAPEAVGLNEASEAVQRLPPQVREGLVWAAVLFAAERSFSIGAIEVATAMILEVQYVWSAEAIGYALTVVFFITAAVGALIWFLRTYALFQRIKRHELRSPTIRSCASWPWYLGHLKRYATLIYHISL